MRIIDITHPPQSLWIGREGENTFRPVSFECANWFITYPNATIAAYYQPYGSSDPYPLVLLEDGTKRIWNPLLAELIKGDGELQIVLMNGETVGTSAIIPTKVDRSLISNAEHPASEAPAWSVKVVQDVTEQVDRVEEATSHYPKIVNGVWYVWDAVQGEFVSTGISAQGEDGVSPTVTVTAIEGGHRVTITDASGDHTFDVMDGESGSGSADAVLYTEQTLTPAQKAQARGNIGAGTYTKPSGGIPDSDIASAATWNAKYTKPASGIPATDLASDVQTSLGKADTAVQPSAIAGMATQTWVENKGYQTAQDVQTAVEGVAPFVIPIVETSSGWELDPKSTLTATDIYNGIKQRDGTGSVQIAVVDESSTKYYSVSYFTFYEEGTEDPANTVYAEFSFGIEYQNGKYIDRIVAVQAQPWEDPEFQLTIDEMPKAIGTSLPTVTASDNGKSLVVENGAWGKGYQAARTPRVAMTASDATPTLDPNKLYVFPTMASLTPTLATPTDNTIVNEYHFVFDSGSTATVLTLPATILQPDGFTVEANMHYEVSILEGAMTAQGWAVSA